MADNTNLTSLSGTEDGSGGGGKHNVNAGILGAVTAAATTFSTDANFINAVGEGLLTLAHETLPNQNQRLLEVEAQNLGLNLQVALLELRVSRLGRWSSAS